MAIVNSAAMNIGVHVSFVTLTVLKRTGQIFVHCPSIWVGLMFSHDQIEGTRTLRRDCHHLSMHHIKGCVMSICLVTGDVKFDRLIRWYLLGFSTVKWLFLSFYLIHNLKEIIWNSTNILFLLKLCSVILASTSGFFPHQLALWWYNLNFCFSLPSAFITWNSFVRKSCPFSSKYLFIQLFIYISMNLWIFTLFYGF